MIIRLHQASAGGTSLKYYSKLSLLHTAKDTTPLILNWASWTGRKVGISSTFCQATGTGPGPGLGDWDCGLGLGTGNGDGDDEDDGDNGDGKLEWEMEDDSI